MRLEKTSDLSQSMGQNIRTSEKCFVAGVNVDLVEHSEVFSRFPNTSPGCLETCLACSRRQTSGQAGLPVMNQPYLQKEQLAAARDFSRFSSARS